MEHKTGYYCWLFGERTWHRSEAAAIAKASRQTWCSAPQVIEIETGRLAYGVPS